SSTRVRADTISINLYNESAADPTVHQLVAGEVAGIVPAANWNNLPFVGGTNDHSTALIPLNNASGAMAANFQSTLTTGYVGNFDDVVASTAPTSANRKFMQSYLSFDNDPNDSPFDEGSLIISGLGSPFTTSTYNMIVYFDADRNDRRHTVTVNGTDVIGDDDSTWDGTFRKAVGPGVSANYAVFEGLSANTVTINMASSSGRAAVNAIQITTDAIPTPHPVLSINRDTGAITLINGTASDIPLAAYLIRSAAGSLDQTHWRSIADNYDVSGNGSIDASDNWFKFTTPGTFDNLGEGALTSGNISAGQNVILGEAGTWIASPTEDITADLLLADGSHLPTVIEFVGNGGSSFSTADINTDGSVDAADWLILRGNMYNPSAPSDLTAAQSFGIGDINSDGGVDREDFLAFKSAYDAINGAGSFAAMTSVPEPGTYLLAGVPLFAFALRRRFHTSIMCLATCSAMLIATTACAQQSISINLWNADAGSVENNTVVAGRTAGLVPVDGQFWNNLSFPGGVVDAQLTSPLMDSTGNANAATFTSTLQSAFVGFSGAAGAAPDTGDRAMMASYLSYDIAGEGTAPDDLGNLTISGLGNAFTGPGYDVYIYSDADANNRLFSITIGGETRTINDNQTYDGTFNEGGSGSNENFAIFRGLNGGSFSIEMDSSAGRGAVNGIQIVVRDNLPDFLELSVNRATGEVTLQNRTGAGVAIDYYEIRSA
ncbi:MAG: PEP-CTERM sorting domain-containing protein, partial [Planctomycetales bacterium]|nr:PEP-CTERM sorting domain-containing protein [Planctomycetales bacterium]